MSLCWWKRCNFSNVFSTNHRFQFEYRLLANELLKTNTTKTSSEIMVLHSIVACSLSHDSNLLTRWVGFIVTVVYRFFLINYGHPQESNREIFFGYSPWFLRSNRSREIPLLCGLVCAVLTLLMQRKRQNTFVVKLLYPQLFLINAIFPPAAWIRKK